MNLEFFTTDLSIAQRDEYDWFTFLVWLCLGYTDMDMKTYTVTNAYT